MKQFNMNFWVLVISSFEILRLVLGTQNLASATDTIRNLQQASTDSDQELLQEASASKTDCIPTLLLATPQQTLTYTITDETFVYNISPFEYSPESCTIDYSVNREARPYVTVVGGQILVRSDDIEALARRSKKTIQVRLLGKIGGTAENIILSDTTFDLVLKNPCYDPSFIKIEPSDISQIDDYIIRAPKRDIVFEPFQLMSKGGLALYADCGRILYSVSSNGTNLAQNSKPISFIQKSRKISIYADNQSQQGPVNLVIVGYFSGHPSVRSQQISFDFEVIYDQCAFETLNLSKILIGEQIYMLSQMAKTFEFDLKDYFDQKTEDLDCGDYSIIYLFQNEEPPKALFEYTQTSFTVKKLPQNAYRLMGRYKITYIVFMKDYPNVRANRAIQSFRIDVYDPCNVLPLDRQPAICFTQSYVRDNMPLWMADLSDKYIHYGQDYTLTLGKPTDNFGRPIDVRVDLNYASNFVTFQREEVYSLSVSGNSMWADMRPRYIIQVSASYTDIYSVLKLYKKKIHLNILHIMFPWVSPWDLVLFQGEPGNDFNFVSLASQNSEANAEVDPNLKSFLVGKTQDGKIKLGWTHPIKTVENYKQLSHEQLAFEQTNASDETVIVFIQQTQEPVICRIRKAVEVVLLPNGQEDEESYVLERAQITSMQAQEMVIDTNIDEPDELGYHSLVTVTFWKADSFVSQESRAQLSQEQSVTVPFAIQVSEDTMTAIDALLITLLIIVVLLVLASISVAIIGGSITPLWIFFGTMQLLAYACLLDIPQASAANYFMRRVLDIIRMHTSTNLFSIDSDEIEAYTSLINGENSFDNKYFQVLGYTPWFLHNLKPYLLVFLTSIVIMTILSLSFVLSSPRDNTRRRLFFLLPIHVNILLKFAESCFLEVAVCTFLSLNILYSKADIVYASLALFTLLLGLALLCRFAQKTVTRNEKIYQKRPLSSIVRCLFCWDIRPLKQQTNLRKLVAVGVSPLNPDVQIPNNVILDLSKSFSQHSEEHSPQEKGIQKARKFSAPIIESDLPQISQPLRLTSSQLVMPDIFEGGEPGNLEIVEEVPTNQETVCLETERMANLDTERQLRPSKPKPVALRLRQSRELIAIRGRQKALKEVTKRLTIESKTVYSPYMKTFFLDLRLGQSEHTEFCLMATYYLRRILYAITITQMAGYGVIAACLLQFACLGQLCFVVTLTPWKDRNLNWQSQANELAIYIVLSLQLACAASTDVSQIHTIGVLTVLCLALTVLGNLAFCSYYLGHQAFLLHKRVNNGRSMPMPIPSELLLPQKKVAQGPIDQESKKDKISEDHLPQNNSLGTVERISQLEIIAEEDSSSNSSSSKSQSFSKCSSMQNTAKYTQDSRLISLNPSSVLHLREKDYEALDVAVEIEVQQLDEDILMAPIAEEHILTKRGISPQSRMNIPTSLTNNQIKRMSHQPESNLKILKDSSGQLNQASSEVSINMHERENSEQSLSPNLIRNQHLTPLNRARRQKDQTTGGNLGKELSDMNLTGGLNNDSNLSRADFQDSCKNRKEKLNTFIGLAAHKNSSTLFEVDDLPSADENSEEGKSKAKTTTSKNPMDLQRMKTLFGMMQKRQIKGNDTTLEEQSLSQVNFEPSVEVSKALIEGQPANQQNCVSVNVDSVKEDTPQNNQSDKSPTIPNMQNVRSEWDVEEDVYSPGVDLIALRKASRKALFAAGAKMVPDGANIKLKQLNKEQTNGDESSEFNIHGISFAAGSEIADQPYDIKNPFKMVAMKTMRNSSVKGLGKGSDYSVRHSMNGQSRFDTHRKERSKTIHNSMMRLDESKNRIHDSLRNSMVSIAHNSEVYGGEDNKHIKDLLHLASTVSKKSVELTEEEKSDMQSVQFNDEMLSNEGKANGKNEKLLVYTAFKSIVGNKQIRRGKSTYTKSSKSGASISPEDKSKNTQKE